MIKVELRADLIERERRYAVLTFPLRKDRSQPTLRCFGVVRDVENLQAVVAVIVLA